MTTAPEVQNPSLLVSQSQPTLAPAVSENPGHYNTGKDISLFYHFGRTLGKGSFATVKVATCLLDQSKWACKIIEKKALNEEDREGLKVEVETMMKVDHNNIVRLKEVFDTPTKFYMVLELCSGGELFDRIVELEHYSEVQALEAFAQMVEAVGHCHKLKIVHRDLKPENLLYFGPMPEMCLKLADFGLAQIITPSTRMATACGTPGYVAPEILKGRTYNESVDMWSLGVILYILLCGFPPFYEEHTPDLFRIIKKGVYEFPAPYWSEVSDSAKDLINHLLVVDPSQRYTAAQCFDHPWMKDPKAGSGTGKELVHFQGNLRKYNGRRKFKGVVEGIMMANIMKNMLKKRTSSAVAEAGAVSESGNAPPQAAAESSAAVVAAAGAEEETLVVANVSETPVASGESERKVSLPPAMDDLLSLNLSNDPTHDIVVKGDIPELQTPKGGGKGFFDTSTIDELVDKGKEDKDKDASVPVSSSGGVGGSGGKEVPTI